MKILEKLKMILCIIAAVLGTNVFAAEYEDILRVGIYYGSGALESFSAESADGFAVGYFDNRVFNPVVVSSETAVTVHGSATDMDNTWHVSYGECRTVEETVARIVEQTHQENTSIIKYNDENALACVVTLAFYTARNQPNSLF